MVTSEALIKYPVRAKYILSADGKMRLSNICSFSRPVFSPVGWESAVDSPVDKSVENSFDSASKITSDSEIVRRSIRRAKVQCMDYILCNDFDLFTTLTYSSDYVDRTSYNDVYRRLSVWLSNLVQRHEYIYIAVPEFHHDGVAIHFHMLSSCSGLNLVDSGHFRNGKAIYNIKNWKYGFSTAQYVTGESAREKCAKYIFKYMGKQMGQKIGGRYYLSGGKLNTPVYRYGETVEEFLCGSVPRYTRELETDGGKFTELSFI